MKKKGYTLILITFSVLIVLTLVFFGLTLYSVGSNFVVVYLFAAASAICLISAFLLMAVNYKKIMAYDCERISRKR